MASTPGIGDVNGDGAPEVVFGSDDRKVWAVSVATGAPLWTRETGGVVSSSPRLADLDGDGAVEVVVGSGDEKVYVLAGRDGSVRWTAATGGPVTASPLLADLDRDGRLDVVVGSHSGRVLAWRGVDGAVLWDVPMGAAVWAGGAVADLDGKGVSDVVVGALDGRVRALSGKDGRVLWGFRAWSRIEATPAVGDLSGDGVPDVLVGAGDGRMYALDGRDGAVLWGYRTGGPVAAEPLLADLDGDGRGEALVGSRDGRLYALTAGPARPPSSCAEAAARVARCARHESFLRVLAASPTAGDPFGAPVRRLRALAALALGQDAAALEAWCGGGGCAEARVITTIALGRMGRRGEARVCLAEALRLDALATEEAWAQLFERVDAGDVERWREAAAAAAGDVGLAPESRGMAWLLAGEGGRAEAEIGVALARGDASPAWYFHRGARAHDRTRIQLRRALCARRREVCPPCLAEEVDGQRIPPRCCQYSPRTSVRSAGNRARTRRSPQVKQDVHDFEGISGRGTLAAQAGRVRQAGSSRRTVEQGSAGQGQGRRGREAVRGTCRVVGPPRRARRGGDCGTAQCRPRQGLPIPHRRHRAQEMTRDPESAGQGRPPRAGECPGDSTALDARGRRAQRLRNPDADASGRVRAAPDRGEPWRRPLYPLRRRVARVARRAQARPHAR